MSNIEKLVHFCKEEDNDGTLIPAFLALLEFAAVTQEQEETDNV